MNLTELQKQIDSKREIGIDLRNKLEIIYQEINDLTDLRNEKICKTHFKNGITPKSFMEMNPDHISKKWHKKISNYVEQIPSLFGSRPQYLKVNFNQNLKFEDQLNILDFIPFLKSNKDDIKYVDIFEHTCAQYGCYSLDVTDLQKIKLSKIAYHRTSIEKEFTDIKLALKFVYDNLPYTKKKCKDPNEEGADEHDY